MTTNPATFEARITALRERGFEVDLPTGDLASEQMILLEKQAEQAGRIRARVLNLPENRFPERERMLDRLVHPEEAEGVEIDLISLLRQHRPWVLVAERSRMRWSDEGRSVELSRILDRLDGIDDALVLAAPRITNLIETAAPRGEIAPVLSELERRHERRLGALGGMSEMLADRGWDVGGLTSGVLHERFATAEHLHHLDATLARCQRRIESEVRPYGDELAERLWQATVLAQREADAEGVHRVEEEIESTAVDLVKRLAKVEERISDWQADGFEITASLPLLASEMVQWERRLPVLAEQVEATHAIWSPMEPHLAQWPEYRRLAERTRGHLGALDALEVLAQGLAAKTESTRSACHSRIEVWAASGIDTSTWAPLIDGEPRAVLEELEMHQALVDLLIPLIAELESLDSSLRGADEVVLWLEQLRHRNAGLAVVDEVRAWLEIADRRVTRHREHLDRARRDLATLWPAKLDPGKLDLAAYETAVSGLESGAGISPSHPQPEVATPLDRVSEGLERELQAWATLGWSVQGLYELLEQDPVRLGLDLVAIRSAIDGQEARIARLGPLPWGLDVDLAERVLSDLKQPERLPGLDGEVPNLMRALSSGGGRADPDFEFIPFRPGPPRAHIEPPLPVLTPEEPAETSTEDDSVAAVEEAAAEPEESDELEESGEPDEVVESEIKASAGIDWLAESDQKSPRPSRGPPVKASVDWLVEEKEEEYQFDTMVRSATMGRTHSPKPKAESKIETKVKPKVEPDSQPEPMPESVTEPKAVKAQGKAKVRDSLSDFQKTKDGAARELLGLSQDDDSITDLLDAPMDVRVQRLARIAVLLEQGGSAEHQALFKQLKPLARRLTEWTAERLSRRHASSGRGLLLDAKALGERLADIPGPGAAIPLKADGCGLPDVADTAGLASAIRNLDRAVRLPSARMQAPEAVEV